MVSAAALDDAIVSDNACRHCGGVLRVGERGAFCCTGCRVVHGLLSARGITRYYDLREPVIGPVAPPPRVDLKWLDAVEAAQQAQAGAERIAFDLQGVQCTACVWLIEALFERFGETASRLSATVNPALGRVELFVTAAFPLRTFVEELARFGYVLGPARANEPSRANELLGRIGLCAAFAMNAMIFSIPVHLGLRSGSVYTVFRSVAMLCGVGSVFAGGSVFFKSAWRCVRRGVLHLDIPIALGVALSFAGSLWSFAAGHDRGAFFDTLAVFVALMLTGRWLQERVIERNRSMLLASDGADGLLARRVRDGKASVVRCGELEAGDTLLVAAGDLVPVEAELLAERAQCSLDWISGESRSRAFARGEKVPAGAFNAGTEPLLVRATQGFADSALPALLRTTRADDTDASRSTAWWQRLTRVYVVAVIALAAACFAYWAGVRHDVWGALQASTALLVVTCPCAFGIATPAAYELVYAGLRRAGLFVRSPSLLDRLPDVRAVVFDKTGTLTTGSLALRNPEALAALVPADRDALYNMVVRSTHPKSGAVRTALEESGELPAFDDAAEVREHAGLGLELRRAGRAWRIGAGAWADGSSDPLVFACDGVRVAAFDAAETLRPDARDEIAALEREGCVVSILSGDDPRRVAEVADFAGVPQDRAVGGCSPDDKARWITAHDHRDTWMIGDGINDGPAAERAYCSATPAVDRAFMPARTDAWFVTAGLRPVRLALLASRALARIHTRNLAVATVYNVGTVSLAFAGRMSPLLCAVVMPLTSLSILLATIASLSPRSALWRS